MSAVGCTTGNSQEAEKSTSDTTAETSEEPAAHTNELAKETSPYLLMHAHNPVNWRAWNEETLAKAKAENKPIFLSIGYSSCHWCHVMERESFLDKEIAEYLNKHFICIKVDREERPDVDEIYMESLNTWNRMTGSRRGGGWPLSMFLLPDGRPFFGGTYFPARTGDRGKSVGFLTVIQKINQLLTENRDRVEKDAEVITQATREALTGRTPPVGAKIQPSWITDAKSNLQEDFDPEFGGFRFSQQDPNIPKFPEPSNLLFLIDQLRRNPQDAEVERMLSTTCERMLMGGIYDHLGGGFHRYSVDRYWRIPHYEKMLYDNGQLASVYAAAYELTGRQEFRAVVEGILAFVQRELTAEEGGFYASLDAESEGEEGKFYVWDLAEIKSALSGEEFNLFASIYGLNAAPNFEGKYYAPQLDQPLVDHAKRLDLTVDELQAKLEPIRQKLLDARSKRIKPPLDSKILTGWNGLMIRGFADSGRILKQQVYLDTATRAADFVLENLTDGNHRLFRTHTDGQAKLNAYLIDYACLIDGLLALHQATGDAKWLQEAEKFQQKQDELFWDDIAGGYFYTSKDHEALLARSKKPIDSAIPAGNSISAGNLNYLAQQTNDDNYRRRAEQTVISAAPILEQIPTAAPRLLITAEDLLAN